MQCPKLESQFINLATLISARLESSELWSFKLIEIIKNRSDSVGESSWSSNHDQRGPLRKRCDALFGLIANLATRDYFSGFERYLGWTRTPAFWLVLVALASGVLGQTVSRTGWIICGIVSCLLLIGFLWPRIVIAGTKVELSFSVRRCHELDVVPLKVSVMNRLPFPVWGLIVETGNLGAIANSDSTIEQIQASELNPNSRWVDLFSDEQRRFAIARIPAFCSTSIDVTVVMGSRGVFPSAAVDATCGFPFGLWTFRKRVLVKNQLTVWPKLKSISIPTEQLNSRNFFAERFVNRTGQEGDLLGARPYREGDSLKRIHWGHSARCDKLITTERQASHNSQVLVVVENPASSTSIAVIDECCRLAAGVAEALIASGYEVVARVSGDSLRINGRQDRDRFFDLLSRVEPAANKSASQACVARSATAYSITFRARPDGCDDVSEMNQKRPASRGLWVTVTPSGVEVAAIGFRRSVANSRRFRQGQTATNRMKAMEVSSVAGGAVR